MHPLNFLFTFLLFILFSFPVKAQQWAVYDTVNSGLPDDWIKKIIIDASGNKWLIDHSNNLVKYDNTSWSIYNYSNSGLPQTVLNSLAIDKNNLLLICTDGGLVEFDNSVWTKFNVSNSCLTSNRISDCAVDSSNNIWLATGSGIVKFDSSHHCSIYSNANGNALYDSEVKVDSRNWIWTISNPFTGQHDLSYFNGSSWNNYSSALIASNFDPSALYCDSVGNVWGSCAYGIFKFDGTNITVPYDLTTSATFSNLGSVFVKSNLIAASSLPLQDLNYYDGNTWTVYNNSNSPLIHEIFNMASDRYDNLWMAGYSGLFEFNPNGITNEISTLRNQELDIISYPNPTSNSFFISLKLIKSDTIKLTLFEINGKEIPIDYKIDKEGKNGCIIQLDLQNFKSGVYLYKINSKNIFATGKIIVLN